MAEQGPRPSRKPFRFLADPGDVADGAALREVARRAESMGYAALVYPDHVIAPLGMVPVLASIAAVTDTLRVAPFVANNDLRHPALLAQDLATIDVLSGGRVDVAMGAGWNRPEYDALGLAFDPVGVRVSRLTEAVAIVKGCFGDGPFSYAGTHYTITELDGYPKPVQRPHPPFLIGGGGRRTLALAGREADIVGLAPRILSGQRSDPASLTVAAAAEKIEWVREAAGDRFDDLVFNVYPSTWPIVITDDPRAEARKVIERLRGRNPADLTEDEVLESPHLFIGTVESLVEKVQGLRERLGISSFLFGDIDELAPVVARLAGR